MSGNFDWDCKDCAITNEYSIECSGCQVASTDEYKNKVIADAKARFAKYGQSHVFQYMDKIKSNSDLNKLLLQIYSIDCQQMQDLYTRAMAEEKSRADEEKSDNKSNDSAITPFPHKDAFNIDTIGDTQKLYDLGFKAISEGKCCCIVLAGGQGTRLGFNKPKGCYPIGAVSNATIYQSAIEKVSNLKSQTAEMFGKSADQIRCPIYFMTSEATHNGSLEFLEKNKYFGYSPSEDIKLFKQQLFPCLTEKEGKFIMKSECEIAMSPNGNGGIYSSLIRGKNGGIFKEMCDNGIEHIQVFGIDNIMARFGDPLWFGHMIDSGIDSSNKTCIKTDPHEKVGIMCLNNGKPSVTEYTELTQEMITMKQAKNDKALEYCYGNLAMHMFNMEFIKKICTDESGKYQLPIHIARKQIPYFDESEMKTVKPSEKNGIKLEFFVFDTYKYSNKCSVYNILRAEEFAPVKNAKGKDSPLTARQAHSEYWKKEMAKCGATLEGNDTDFAEVSPLFAYLPYDDNAQLKKRVNGKTFKLPFCFALSDNKL